MGRAQVDWSGEMETMLQDGDKWSQRVLATPGEDGHLWAHAAAYLITTPPQGEKTLPPHHQHDSLPPVASTLPLSSPSAFTLQNGVILIQLMNVDECPVHYPLKMFLLGKLKFKQTGPGN